MVERHRSPGSGDRWCDPPDEAAVPKPCFGMAIASGEGSTQWPVSDEGSRAVEICEYETTPEDLLVANLPKPKRLIKVALDSGAGDHVAGPTDIEGLRVEESEGSRNGRHFVAANKQRIANEGQVRARLKDEGNRPFDTIFQVADVSRPLYSVSRLCDHGCSVTFDANEGRVTKKGQLLARFKRSGGLYVADLGMDETPAPAVFAGQGGKA